MGILQALGLKKDEYHNKINSEMTELDAQVERERAERKSSAEGQEPEHDEDYEAYRTHRADADEKLANLRNASEDKWEDIKTGVEKALLEARNAFNKLSSRIHH